MNTVQLLNFYRKPALTEEKSQEIAQFTASHLALKSIDLQTEYCFYVQTSRTLSENELELLAWLLSETFEPDNFSNVSFFNDNLQVYEVGPRLNFMTPWSANAVSICHNCGLNSILRIERSRRYSIKSPILDSLQKEFFLRKVHDRMTEMPYDKPLTTFHTGIKPDPVVVVPLLEHGIDALEQINKDMGLGFDKHDLAYYYDLFVKKIGRNPTNVECFDLAQSNSEHSRHWFFNGKLVVNGQETQRTLFNIVQEPLKKNPGNSLIAFKDNSSAIKGYKIKTIIPEVPGITSSYELKEVTYHIAFTAETHNFPSGVAPFPGAETGTGGRIRDVQAVGRGGLVAAGTAAYCVGNLNIPGYNLPWEDAKAEYPGNLASPLDIVIEASNGASDYGNKFGEPVIQGFVRSFGLTTSDNKRCEWIKPIMFTSGAGQIDNCHLDKEKPQKGMLIVKVGGPAYRIGMGGGAASSMIQGENTENLDFNAVQRGDAEMEQKMNRIIRACCEMGKKNPIVTIHDQGAGGNSNCVKEILNPEGGRIEIRNILVGDETLSVLEIWGAEYQEQNALLIWPEHKNMFEALCRREKVPCAFIGEVTGDGFVVVHDSVDGSEPVNLELSLVLGHMPPKTFHLEYTDLPLKPLELPDDITVREALSQVLKLLQVGSKRFLTNKVDRSVTGLIARQQCVGPLHLTLSDVAVIAQSHFSLTGAAIAIGEQPIKTLINPQAMARLAAAEALTNLVWAKITGFEDVKCSANWMWAPKLPGEGIKLYQAAIAMADIMKELGIAVDGGKDSLSMAATFTNQSGRTETVISPGTLVISAYAACPDITNTVTPDLKKPGQSSLLYVDLGSGKYRIGASALAQVFGQVGDESPDIDDPVLLKNAFYATQELIDKKLILAGHDRSDGGLIITLLEMAFAGNCGFDVEIKHGFKGQDTIPSSIRCLFAEEPGLVIEYLTDQEQEVIDIFNANNVSVQVIGKTTQEKNITLEYEGQMALNETMPVLRARWEETGFRLEQLQANPLCVRQEHRYTFDMQASPYRVSFNPEPTAPNVLQRKNKPRVAIIREEGSNGDREMASAFYMAGFEPWDLTMTDLLNEQVNLDRFRGAAFVGGFSYADVLDSAKGWAGVIRFNKGLLHQFQSFYDRPDTFSLGVCNGCQLMALIGWVPWKTEKETMQPRFIHNDSHRFESRFSTVTILPSPSIMLKGMENSILGIWAAHGEGKAYFPDNDIFEDVINKELSPVRYVDDRGVLTEDYPFNPNGSPHGIASLCSQDGRHLAMMPHPERTFLLWQWPWLPEEMKENLQASPWLHMFQNARLWCEGNL